MPRNTATVLCAPATRRQRASTESRFRSASAAPPAPPRYRQGHRAMRTRPERAATTRRSSSKRRSSVCLSNPASCGYTGADGIAAVSSSYLVSANFFRTRDTLRQDIIDESQLVRAIAFVPTGAPPTGHGLFDYMAAQGAIIDPSKVYFVAQSLGAIQGTVDVATNPRISEAVLNVGGGTVVDVFTTSPAFSATTNALLAGLGIQAGANSAYLQFLVVA